MKKFAAVLAACAVLSISGAAFANPPGKNGSPTGRHNAQPAAPTIKAANNGR